MNSHLTTQDITCNDILLGSGGGGFNFNQEHRGNRNFAALVHAVRNTNSPGSSSVRHSRIKRRVAFKIYAEVQRNGGRFLRPLEGSLSALDGTATKWRVESRSASLDTIIQAIGQVSAAKQRVGATHKNSCSLFDNGSADENNCLFMASWQDFDC